jgi:glycogen operon protein
MLLMGDEVRRTQGGNNNAYCHDSELSWFDWSLPERHGDIHRFCKRLVRNRTRREALSETTSMSLNQLLSSARFEWHGVKLHQPEWGPDSHSIAVTVWSLYERLMYHLIFNAHRKALEFRIPPASAWRRLMDTSLEPPDDIASWKDASIVQDGIYFTQPYSTVMLVARLPGAAAAFRQENNQP